MMKDFALIIHPINEELLHRYEPGMKNRPRHLVKQVLQWMSPFKASDVIGLRSITGEQKEGYLIMNPLLMEQMVSLNPRFILESTIKAAKFAESLNVKMIGLTAFTSLVGNRGLDISKELKIPVTSGNACTMAMIPEAILRAANIMEIPIAKADILIIGATNDIGKTCIEILGKSAKQIFLKARSEDKLTEVIKSASSYIKSELTPINDVSRIIKKTKIVIIASNNAATLFDIKKISPGTIVLDASYPREISPNIRNDVLVIDGVAIKPPGNVHFGFDFGLPEGLAFPCMVEVLALALENRFESFSLAKNLKIDKMLEITNLMNKHGFKIAELTSIEKILPKEKILEIKERISKNNLLKKHFFTFK